MSYSVFLAQSFRASVRQLERRFRRVKDDVKVAVRELEQDPYLGTVVPGSFGIRKLRIPSSDAQRGKSGGYRLIYWVDSEQDTLICLLLLYFKGDRSDVSSTELRELLRDVRRELEERQAPDRQAPE